LYVFLNKDQFDDNISSESSLYNSLVIGTQNTKVDTFTVYISNLELIEQKSTINNINDMCNKLQTLKNDLNKLTIGTDEFNSIMTEQSNIIVEIDKNIDSLSVVNKVKLLEDAYTFRFKNKKQK